MNKPHSLVDIKTYPQMLRLLACQINDPGIDSETIYNTFTTSASIIEDLMNENAALHSEIARRDALGLEAIKRTGVAMFGREGGAK